MRKSPNFADKDLHVSNPNSGTPHVNRRSRIGKSFIYKVVQKSVWTLYTFALISVWSCQKIPKIQDLSVLIHAFSVLLLKRYCFENIFFTFFQNYLFHETSKLTGWLEHGISWIFRVEARYYRRVECFSFFYFIVNAPDNGHGNRSKTQKIHFFDFFEFF